MIDTIKFGIRVSKHQHSKIQKFLSEDDAYQWVKYQPSTKTIALVRCKGLLDTDCHSYHREIKYDLPNTYEYEKTYLVAEFSIPKFWIGHNIHLVYDYLPALQYFKKLLEQQLHCKFEDVLQWQIFRLDVCYAWKCPSQNIAQQVLNSLKGFKYPWKKNPIIYTDSILFPGTTYSFKFYLKLPEFEKHDEKAMAKSGFSYEWINHLKKRASGVLRCEATLRRKWLKRNQIETINDLLEDSVNFEFTEEYKELNSDLIAEDSNQYRWSAFVIADYYFKKFGFTVDELIKMIKDGESIPLHDGYVLEAPACILNIDGEEYKHNGGGFSVSFINKPFEFLENCLDKFLGENRNMQEHNEVKSKLLEHYKAVKAARLHSVWLYVEKYGMQDAKNLFGKNSFNRAKRELKAAGCSFVEPPKVIKANDKFIKNFQLHVPSIYVVNDEDDFRDSENLINLIKDKTGTSD